MSEDIAFAKKISRERRQLKIYIPKHITKKYGLHDGMYVEIHMRVIKSREPHKTVMPDGTVMEIK